MAQDIDPELARALKAAMGGVGERRRDPITDEWQRTQQRASEQQAAQQAAAEQKAATDKQALVDAMGKVRESLSTASDGLNDAVAQAPTAQELRVAAGTALTEIRAAVADNQPEADAPPAEQQAAQQAREQGRLEAIGRLTQTTRTWGEQLGQVTESVRSLEAQLSSAQTTLSETAGTANETLRPDFDRVGTALQSNQDSVAELRGHLEQMTSRAQNAAEYTPPPPLPPGPDGSVLLADTLSQDEVVADVAGELDGRLGRVTPGAALEQVQSDLGTTMSEIDELSSRIGSSEPAAVLPAEQAEMPRAAQAADGAAYRGGARTTSHNTGHAR